MRDTNLTGLNRRVNNFTRQSWRTFFVVFLKWICRLYLFSHNDFVKSFSKVTVLPSCGYASLPEHAKSGAFSGITVTNYKLSKQPDFAE